MGHRSALRWISRITPWLAALAAVTVLGAPAGAHFLLNLNVRIFHVEHRADGLDVYLRLPMPYLVAERLGPLGDDDLPAPAPYTTNALEGDRLVHFVDRAAFAADALGLGRFAAEGLRVATDAPLAAEVVAVRIHPNESGPPFATLDEAKQVFETPRDEAGGESPLYVGDASVDVLLRYPTREPVREYRISSSLDPGLPGQDDTANLVLDYAPGGVEVFRARGLLREPITVSRSALAAFRTFVIEGIRHILEGLDHVLFVICLVLGAQGLRALVGRVTGFTIGHSVTLGAGFFGLVPDAAWFVPTVELGIAVSILYAAAVAVIPRFEHGGDEWTVFGVTAAIGLLHGLGFSFVLRNILSVTSPDIWQSLLAFNVGVEIGQVAIVLVTWAVLRSIRHFGEGLWLRMRWGVAAVCAAFALLWTIERTWALLS